MALLDIYGLQQLDQWCLKKLLLRFFFSSQWGIKDEDVHFVCSQSCSVCL